MVNNIKPVIIKYIIYDRDYDYCLRFCNTLVLLLQIKLPYCCTLQYLQFNVNILQIKFVAVRIFNKEIIVKDIYSQFVIYIDHVFHKLISYCLVTKKLRFKVVNLNRNIIILVNTYP